MAAPAPRMLRVRCTTWDQVEAFYRRKLRAGGRLTMKVAFATAVGAPITLVLELPNQIALSIDGEVTAGEGEGKPVEVTLRGLTAALVGRLESLVADARSGALDPEAQDDETRMLSARRTELARLQRLPAHEVLGVPRDPSPHELRSGWLALARREHPDALARYASPALTAVATEVMALAGAAFERVRAAEIALGRAVAVGASLRPAPGWGRDDDSGPIAGEPIAPTERAEAGEGPMPRLVTVPEPVDVVEAAPAALDPELTRPAQLVTLDAMVSAQHAAPVIAASPAAPGAAISAVAADPPASGRVVAGDRFVRRIREHLAKGDHAGAAHVAGAALQLYPDDRSLRALAAVASAMAACARGDRLSAVAALESATASDPSLGEAATALAEIRHAGLPTISIIQRWFE